MTSLRFRSLSPSALADEVARRCLDLDPEPVVRVALDGADAARPAELADAVAQRLELAGRPCARVSLTHWWRPASVRLEHGRDADAYRRWFDLDALGREVLDPLGPGGSGEWLPMLWDAGADRSTRAQRRTARTGTVLLVDGPMLLGQWLPFELGVHLHLSAAALLRRTPAEQHWTVDALVDHEQEVGTDDLADVLVRVEHADRPALALR
ncbi:MAG: uridine kinase [Mycobacteriaceae bacterium]